jgi:peptidyl-prolyl cis-trans isomerase C
MRTILHLSLAALLIGLCATGCKRGGSADKNVSDEKSPVMTTSAGMPALMPAGTGGVAAAASVDGVTLSRNDLMMQLQAVMAAQQVPEEQQQMAVQVLAPRLVNAFVTKTLLLAEARRLKLAVEAADRAKFLKPFEEMATKQGTTMDEMLRKAPMGEKAARQELDEQMLIEKLVDSQIRSKLKIDDKAVDAALAEASKERDEKRAEIDSIRTQLLAGTNFAALARERSDCPSGKQAGGDLGSFARDGSMVKPFEDAAFSQKVNDIGPVVETQFGFHVIKVTARNDAKAASGDTPATPETVQASHILVKAPRAVTRDEMRKETEDRQIGQEMRSYLTALRGKAKITTMFDKQAGAPAAGPDTLPE